MIVIGMMIAEYQSFHRYPDEEMFRLFDKARAVNRAETEADFQAAIADL